MYVLKCYSYIYVYIYIHTIDSYLCVYIYINKKCFKKRTFFWTFEGSAQVDLLDDLKQAGFLDNRTPGVAPRKFRKWGYTMGVSIDINSLQTDSPRSTLFFGL